jgi:hypothetical protein
LAHHGEVTIAESQSGIAVRCEAEEPVGSVVDAQHAVLVENADWGSC